MKTARSCLVWFALYAVLAVAIAFAVERRAGRHAPVLIGCAIAGFVGLIGFTHLENFG